MDPVTGAVALGGIGLIANHFSNQAANDSARAAAKKNAALQKEFAQHGIRWKIEDAKRAGIHPLAALGTQTQSFQPTYMGDQPSTIGSDLSNLGQDVSRAMIAKATPEEQTLAKMQIQSAQLDIEGKALDNQLRASQLQKLNSAPPPLPSAMGNTIPGQGNSGFTVKPSELTASRSGVPAQEAGAVNDYAFARTQSGYAVVPSQDVKSRIEDQMIPELAWSFRNQLLPAFSGHTAPDTRQYPLPSDSVRRGARHWKWNPFVQEFRPHTGKYFVD